MDDEKAIREASKAAGGTRAGFASGQIGGVEYRARSCRPNVRC